MAAAMKGEMTGGPQGVWDVLTAGFRFRAERADAREEGIVQRVQTKLQMEKK